MEILNNREIAIALWILAISLYIALSSKMKSVRGTFPSLLKSIFSRPILTLLLIALTYTSFSVYLLSELGLWDINQLKNTVFWFFSVGIITLYNLEKTKNDKDFFKNSITGSIKILAIIQFIVGVYTFPLPVEILIVPLAAIIGGMIPLAEKNPEHHAVKNILERITICFGLFTICYTLYMLLTNFHELAQEKTLYDFVVPALLTALYAPFTFLVIVYSTYENTFIGLQFAIKDTKLRALAKIYAIIFINLRISLLSRWSGYINSREVTSHKHLIETFRHLRLVRKLESSTLAIPISQGWNPYSAKNFLQNEGIYTRHYDLRFDDQWSAASKLYELSNDLNSNNIAYYVEGFEGVAKTLKIKLNINDSSHAEAGHKRLLELSKTLINKSLGTEISSKMTSSILAGEPYHEEKESIQISIKKDIWPRHKLGGYDIKLEILSTSLKPNENSIAVE